MSLVRSFMSMVAWLKSESVEQANGFRERVYIAAMQVEKNDGNYAARFCQ